MDAVQRIRFKTRVFAVIVILSNALGNLFLTWGLKHEETHLAISPLDYIKAIFNPWVGLGIALLIAWMLARMAMLSWADLSYVLPVTAAGYVVTALMGMFFLHEHIPMERWAGTLLIVAGVVLVGRGNPQTTAADPVAAETRVIP